MGIAALAAGIVCWGVTPVLLRRLTPFIDAWTANGLRYPISAILYWPLLWQLSRSGKLTLALCGSCIVPALLSTCGQVFWGLAMYDLPASEIGFLIRTSTAWAIIASMLLFPDERVLLKQPKFYVGLAMIVAGFLIMSLAGASVATETVHDIPVGNHAWGVTCILLSSAFFGLYIASIRYFIPDTNPTHAFSIVAQIVSVVMVIGLFIKGDVAMIPQQTVFSWSLLIGSSILGIGIGHILVYTAVQRLGASITSSCQSVLPFATVAVASVVLSERLTSQQWLGGITMIVGALVLLSIKHKIATPID